jgi:hypothetical protein
MRAMTWGQRRSLAVTQRRPKRSLTWEHRGRSRARNELLSSRSDAPAAYAVDPGASADPAGLTAKARPGRHAANLLTQPPRLPNRLFMAHASSCVTSTGSGRVRDAASARSDQPA